jgi:hypothetical protein
VSGGRARGLRPGPSKTVNPCCHRKMSHINETQGETDMEEKEDKQRMKMADTWYQGPGEALWTHLDRKDKGEPTSSPQLPVYEASQEGGVRKKKRDAD